MCQALTCKRSHTVVQRIYVLFYSPRSVEQNWLVQYWDLWPKSETVKID